MTIQEFARRNRLKTRLDKADDTTVIFGKVGLIYEYSLDDSLLGVMFITPATAQQSAQFTPRAVCDRQIGG